MIEGDALPFWPPADYSGRPVEPMPHLVLITDDEAPVHELLKRALSPTGASVVDAYNGEEALKVLAERPIDLLVTDVMMPGMDGLALVRTLRETGNKKFPVVVCTSMDESVKESLTQHLAFDAAGMDRFVRKPFSVGEVSKMFQEMLSKLEPIGEMTESQAFEGELTTLSFLDLIQLLQNAKLTGRLEFNQPEPGKIFVTKGQVIDAQCGRVVGRKAFYRMLAWTKGEFRFLKQSSLRAEKRIETDTTALILGGLAHLDEHRRLLSEVPTVVRVAVKPETFRSPLSENERELLALVVEKGTALEVLDAVPREDLPVLRDIKALLDRGLIDGSLL